MVAKTFRKTLVNRVKKEIEMNMNLEQELEKKLESEIESKEKTVEKKMPESSYKTEGQPLLSDPRMSARGVNVFYGDKQAIFDVDLDIGKNQVVAMIGPSGCGKSTFLRCLNRMNDTIEICRVSGEIQLDGEYIYGKNMDVVELRARVCLL